jgi:hypothetical protein
LRIVICRIEFIDILKGKDVRCCWKSWRAFDLLSLVDPSPAQNINALVETVVLGDSNIERAARPGPRHDRFPLEQSGWTVKFRQIQPPEIPQCSFQILSTLPSGQIHDVADSCGCTICTRLGEARKWDLSKHFGTWVPSQEESIVKGLFAVATAQTDDPMFGAGAGPVRDRPIETVTFEPFTVSIRPLEEYRDPAVPGFLGFPERGREVGAPGDDECAPMNTDERPRDTKLSRKIGKGLPG